MESSVGATLVRFMSAHGDPKIAIELLSDHYTGLAQMANVMSDWLGITGNVRIMYVGAGEACFPWAHVYYTHARHRCSAHT